MKNSRNKNTIDSISTEKNLFDNKIKKKRQNKLNALSTHNDTHTHKVIYTIQTIHTSKISLEQNVNEVF